MHTVVFLCFNSENIKPNSITYSVRCNNMHSVLSKGVAKSGEWFDCSSKRLQVQGLLHEESLPELGTKRGMGGEASAGSECGL